MLPNDIVQRQAATAPLVSELLAMVSPELRKPTEEAPAVPEVADIEQLPAAINQCRKQGKAYEIRRVIASVTYSALQKVGSFHCATEQRTYFLDKRTGFLHELDSERFANLLATLTGLNKTEPEFGFVG